VEKDSNGLDGEGVPSLEAGASVGGFGGDDYGQKPEEFEWGFGD
jgi:hypothetical protein